MGELRDAFGSARHSDRNVAHPRPPGVDDATVDAVGKVSAAFEVVENARGLLYQFHRMSGEADLALQEALAALREAGHEDLAGEIDDVLVGRDVVGDMWTFQIVESYDEQYWSAFKAADELVRTRLAGGTPHVFEAEMKQREQTEGAS